MKRSLLAAGLLALAGCGGGAARSIEERALEPLGDRAGAFRAVGLEGADREAYFWLLWRAARRHTVTAGGTSTVDAEGITPEFLASRVAQARLVQQYPWAPKDEEEWRRGLLMYRVATEPITDWHAYWGQDAAVADKVRAFATLYADRDHEETLKALLHYLNAEVLGARVKKIARQPPDLDPETCVKQGGGRGTDLAIAAVTLFRAWGIPAVLMRCPLVNGEAGGDAWIGITGTDIWMKPADTAERSPEYFAYRRGDVRLSKVYACEDRNDYPELVSLRDALPFRIQYGFVWQPAADASAQLPGAVPVSLPDMPVPAFLSLYVAGGWVEVAPGHPRDDDSADFGPCAPGMLYLPTTPGPRGIQAPAGVPFVLNADGSRTEFAGDGPDVEWAWSPPPDVPGAKAYLWVEGRFVFARWVDRDGKRLLAGPRNAMWLVWREGPENGGLGKPVGRPFVVGDDGQPREY